MKITEEIWLIPFSRQWTVLRRLYLIPVLIALAWALMLLVAIWWEV